MPPDTTPRSQADAPARGPAPVDAARARRAALLVAISRLELALAGPARDPAWIGRVRDGVGRLSATFDDHVTATEGAAGIYSDIRRSAPRLEFAVGRLELEHVEIRSAIDALDALAGEARLSDSIERIRTAGTDVLARLVRHRQRGADLIFEAYEQDIGGRD